MRSFHIVTEALSLLFVSAASVSCGGALGSAPVVLTKVPNGTSGQAFIARAAEKSGCRVGRRSDGLLLECPEGTLHVPMFAGPPTFAVRCIDGKVSDVTLCRALVRRVLLSTDPG